MLCKIADLIVDVPEAGGMYPRCREYLCKEEKTADIIISAEEYRQKAWPSMTEKGICYMESGVQFYSNLLHYEGLMLHASAVELDGRAYLFSGFSGTGKSTHTKLWQQTFGSAAQVFNDDKPALRRVNGVWYAYGTPWCGKDGININMKVPVAGICFLKQAQENRVREMENAEAAVKLISQTRRRFRNVERVDLMLRNIEQLLAQIPVFELENRPEPEAARLSYETMRRKAEELGL